MSLANPAPKKQFEMERTKEGKVTERKAEKGKRKIKELLRSGKLLHAEGQAGRMGDSCEHAAAYSGEVGLLSQFWQRTYELALQGVLSYKKEKQAQFAESRYLECLTCGKGLIETAGRKRTAEGKPVQPRLSCVTCLQAGQVLAFHSGLAHLYCCLCESIVFDAEFDAVRCHALLSATKDSPQTLLDYALEPGIGLRGMCNLGNTCYMNSVLQILSQQSSIRDYYLSEAHNNMCQVASIVKQQKSSLDHQKKLCDLVQRLTLGKVAKARPAIHDDKSDSGTSNNSSTNAVSGKKAKKSPALLEQWGLERDSAFLPRYACAWQRPWCSGKFLISNQHQQIDSNGEKKKPNWELGCIACELETLVKDLYTGPNARQPLVLNHFLYSTWQHSPLLSGYMQQDAHEFFSFVVNSAHSADNGDGCFGESRNQKCSCIMHQTFGGMLCSQITCSSCGAVSESFEPFFDISLDCPSGESNATNGNGGSSSSADTLSTQQSTTTTTTAGPVDALPVEAHGIEANSKQAGKGTTKQVKHPPSRSPRRNMLTRGLSFNAPPISLESLLDQFIAPETLTSAIQCGNCLNRIENCSKRLRLEALPPTLCFHIKRFKTGTTPSNAQKSDQAVTFPIRGLDMSEFLVQKDVPKVYDLCGVVQHTGNIDSGHYFCFILHHGNWYRCDDVFIRRVFEVEVLDAQGYMLFYQARET